MVSRKANDDSLELKKIHTGLSGSHKDRKAKIHSNCSILYLEASEASQATIGIHTISINQPGPAGMM